MAADVSVQINSNNTPAGESSTTKIQMVPDILRYNFWKKYGPKMVSFGPIHYRNSKYQRGQCFERKKKLTNDFVQNSGKEPDVLKNQISQIIKQLRDCFDKEVTQNYEDGTLASLLYEDGCAILQYMYCRPTEMRMFDVIAQDILLLENQIPYKVLKELMQLSDKKEDLEKSIETFIEESVMVQLDEQAEGNRGDNLPSQANPERDVQIDRDPVHLLDLLRTSLLGKSQAEPETPSNIILPSFRFRNRNVQDLKAAGIHLRQSSDWFLRNIVFRRRFHLLGRLDLPPITVNSATLKLLNLVAYEMCLQKQNQQNDHGVISYLHFLDSLITGPQDFEELRKAGVFCAKYKELDTIFRELNVAGVFTDERNAYRGVKAEIQEYYETRMSKMLQFYHAHIKGSSWPLVSFWGVLLGLLFSGTQAWFTAKT